MFFALKKHNGEFTMAVASKKKISIFEYGSKESKFKYQQELVLPDAAKSLNWSGDKLCVGFKKEYSLIDVLKPSAMPQKLFDTGVSQQNTLGLSLPNETIVVLNGIGVTINFSGKPSRSHGIGWSEAPNMIGYLKPYLIAPLSVFVEVRILSTTVKKDTFIQSLPLKDIITTSQQNFIDLDHPENMDHGMGVGFKVRNELDRDDTIDPENRIFLASKSSIYVMVMKQFDLQAGELLSNQQFELALHLCNTVENTRYKIEDWRVSSIHTQFGFHLFAKGEFDKAMEHFDKTKDDPRMIISLFPDLLPPKSSFKFSLPYTSEEQRKIDHFLKDIEQRNKALQALIQYLLHRRTTEKDLNEQALDEAEAVDTALLKALLYTNDPHVEDFITQPNHCNIMDSQKTLHSHQKFRELVLFYKTKGLHDRALELLKLLGDKSSATSIYTDLIGVMPTINYLKELQQVGEGQQYILEFSKWVLSAEPLRGLKIFQVPNCPISVNEILSHLDLFDHALAMKIAYLEHLIKVEKSVDPNLHNQLLLYYLEYVTKYSTSASNYEEDSVPGLLQPVKDVKRRMNDFLTHSTFYHSEKMLSRFPFDSLYEERAILLSKINRHSQALTIYVTKLESMDKAEKYCEQHYNPDGSEESREIFIILLNMILKQSASTENNLFFEDAIGLLERHFSKIDLIKAIKLLPENVPISDLMKYFEATLRCHTEQKRRAQIMKNINRSENLQVHEEVIKERKRVVKVKPDRTCAVCNKKLGMSAFVCYPNGVVTHYICAKNMNVCPVTGKHFMKL